MWNKQTKRNVVVLLTAMMVVALGLTVAAWAKKPVKPPPDPGDTPRFAQVYLGGNAYGINDAGLPMPSGNYFYRLTVDGQSRSRQMLMLK